MKIKILIPIYNDWRSVFELLKQIDNQISDISDDISILIVNDGSNEEKENIPELKYIKSIKILNMKQNQGHARCNAMGLKYLYDKISCDKNERILNEFSKKLVQSFTLSLSLKADSMSKLDTSTNEILESFCKE